MFFVATIAGKVQQNQNDLRLQGSYHLLYGKIMKFSVFTLTETTINLCTKALGVCHIHFGEQLPLSRDADNVRNCTKTRYKKIPTSACRFSGLSFFSFLYSTQLSFQPPSKSSVPIMICQTGRQEVLLGWL